MKVNKSYSKNFFLRVNSKSPFRFIVALICRVLFLIFNDFIIYLQTFTKKERIIFALEDMVLYFFAPYLVLFYYFFKFFVFFFFYILRLCFVIFMTILEYVIVCVYIDWDNSNLSMSKLEFFDTLHLDLVDFASFLQDRWLKFEYWATDQKYFFLDSSLQFLAVWSFYFFFIVFLDFYVYPFLLKVANALIKVFFDYILSSLIDFVQFLSILSTLLYLNVPLDERNYLDALVRRKALQILFFLPIVFFRKLDFWFFQMCGAIKQYFLIRYFLYVNNLYYTLEYNPDTKGVIFTALTDTKMYFRVIVFLYVIFIKTICYIIYYIACVFDRFLIIIRVKRYLILLRSKFEIHFNSIKNDSIYDFLFFILLYFFILFSALRLLVLKGLSLNYIVLIFYLENNIGICKNGLIFMYFKFFYEINLAFFSILDLWRNKNSRKLLHLDIKVLNIQVRSYLEEKFVFLKHYWRRFVFKIKSFFKKK